MTIEQIAEAMRRAVSVLQRRPASGLHDDAPGLAQWMGGLRIETRHALGVTVPTDMPTELGGTGDQVSPGWMVRSGVAACAATTIAAVAAERGLRLSGLQVCVTSRSDTRGFLGMTSEDGTAVPAGPVALQMQVFVQAADESEADLRALVLAAQARAPMTALVGGHKAIPLTVTCGPA